MRRMSDKLARALMLSISHLLWSNKKRKDVRHNFVHSSSDRLKLYRVTESAEKILSYKQENVVISSTACSYNARRGRVDDEKIIGHNYGIKRFMVKWRKLWESCVLVRTTDFSFCCAHMRFIRWVKDGFWNGSRWSGIEIYDLVFCTYEMDEKGAETFSDAWYNLFAFQKRSVVKLETAIMQPHLLS